GASLRVGRFLGLTPQPPKGTATGANFLAINQALLGTGTSQVLPSLSGYLQGNFNLGAGSVFSVTNGIANSSIISNGTVIQGASPAVFLINGTLIATSPDQIQIPNLVASTSLVSGANLVARSGFNIPGV